jgi:hypothetical protein
MSEPELERKLIVTTNQDGLNQADFMNDADAKIKAQVDNSTIVPGIDPTVSSTQAKAADLRTKFNLRTSLLAQVHQVTGQINDVERELKSDFVEWATQIQKAVAGDVNKVKLLKFGIKGVYDGQSESPISFTNSHLVIVNVFNSGHLIHTIEAVNNLSLTSKLPFDVDHIDLYETDNEANITDLKKMIYLGVMKRSKFINHFNASELNKDFWYVAVYVPKAGVEGGPELSGGVRAKVI